MSLKISYKEAMCISRTNPHSQFIQSSNRKHVKLLPKHIGNIKAGIVEQLDNQLFAYSRELGGVPVAYQNIRLVQNMGRIIADQTCIHFDITADFVLFKPQIGCTLLGVINKVGKQHIGCLVHDKFNAWIPRLNPTAQNEDLAGQEIQFVVSNIFTNNNILSLKGRVEESSFTALKKHKKKNTHTVFDNVDSQADDSAMVTPSQFERDAALSSTRIDEQSPESNMKKKNKKVKHSFDESLNEMGHESIEVIKDGHLKKNKKKKHKHGMDESISEPVTKDTGKECMPAYLGDSQTCRKRKISGAHFDKFTCSSFDESEPGSSKKKKMKEEKHSFDSSQTEVHEEIKMCETAMKKKKKKHKHKLDLSESGHNLTEEIPESVQSIGASQSNITDEMRSLSRESLEQSGTNHGMESDEGYYSKKSKKKHKRKLQ